VSQKSETTTTLWNKDVVDVLLPCRMCHGLSKVKCPACGRQLKQVGKMTDVERIRYEKHKEEITYLQRLWHKCKNLKIYPKSVDENGKLCLDEQTVKKLLLHFGPWYT
jgi:hypothetical protein